MNDLPPKTDHNFVDQLTPEEYARCRFAQQTVCPDDGRYAQEAVGAHLSAEAQWRAFANVQRELLAVRVEFGLAAPHHLEEVDKALPHLDPVNMELLEKHVTKHDQLAVIEEIGRHVSPETKALLHPGTTSYDIVDTARAHLFRTFWQEHLRAKIIDCVHALCELSDKYKEVLQVGRTHLQQTSPVPFGHTLALYAARLAERTKVADDAFSKLYGKVSGIVGTGASVEVVIGEGKGMDFEKAVLARFGLEPDLTATQVTQKERLADVGHALVTLMHVLGDFANDMRLLYSTEISEVTSREDQKRLGGSSADASKNNPIHWENIAGNTVLVESGMRTMYAMIATDLQRDLRASRMGRYQPQIMMAQVYESFVRAARSLSQLAVNHEQMAAHLQLVRRFPGEAMVAILRRHGYVHPEYGVGHSAVKEFSKQAKLSSKPLIDTALEDTHFSDFHKTKLTADERTILSGKLEQYLGSSEARRVRNVAYALSI